MMLNTLKEYLDHNGVKYTTISHSLAYTAREIAGIAHIPGKDLAKSVVIKVDGKPVLAVVPATVMVDFKSVKKALGAARVEMANEKEVNTLFPECEVGAMPPFGNLYNIDVVVDVGLTLDEEIAFNAGTHRELVKMAYRDFERLAQPRIAQISVHRKSLFEESWDYGG